MGTGAVGFAVKMFRVCVCVLICVCVLMHVEFIGQYWLSLPSPFSFYDIITFWPGTTEWDWLASNSQDSLHWDRKCTPSCLAFLCRFWGSSPGLNACRDFPAELHPTLCFCFEGVLT